MMEIRNAENKYFFIKDRVCIPAVGLVGWVAFGRCKFLRFRLFTLAELLVVISIIIILSSILLPALNKSKEKVRSIYCVNNNRQQGLAFGMYLNDYDSYFPHYNLDMMGGFDLWNNVLIKPGYIKISSFICPSMKDVKYEQNIYNSSRGLIYTGYGYNYEGPGSMYSTMGDEGYYMYNRLSRIKKPSLMYVVMDTASGDTDAYYGYYRVKRWFDAGKPTVGLPDGRHLLSVNILYGDGHAAGSRITSKINPYQSLGDFNTAPEKWNGN